MYALKVHIKSVFSIFLTPVKMSSDMENARGTFLNTSGQKKKRKKEKKRDVHK